MRKKLLWVFLISSVSVSAQINTQLKSIKIPCCDSTKSVDYDNNGSNDFYIRSASGLDNLYYDAGGIGTTLVTDPVDYNQALTNFSGSKSLSGTTIGCYGWYSSWYPGDGKVQYVGFRNIKAPGDTTFGWIEMSFGGVQNTCTDTMIINKIGYSSIKNVHVYAGEESVVGIKENTKTSSNNLIRINKIDNVTYLHNIASSATSILMYNLLGQKIFETQLKANEQTSIDISILKGMYIIYAQDNISNQTLKYIKE